MKTINVVAAVIRKDEKILATERGYGEFKGYWEFPGGKIEANETPADALIREIKEELDVEIKVNDLIDRIEYDYPSFHLSMECYFCEIISGKLTLNEAKSAKWLKNNELYTVNWLPADKSLIKTISSLLL